MSGQEHVLTTWTDMVKLHHSLPPERAALFRRELGEALELSSGVLSLAEATGLPMRSNELRWIDDDKRRAGIQINGLDGLSTDLPA